MHGLGQSGVAVHLERNEVGAFWTFAFNKSHLLLAKFVLGDGLWRELDHSGTMPAQYHNNDNKNTVVMARLSKPKDTAPSRRPNPHNVCVVPRLDLPQACSRTISMQSQERHPCPSRHVVAVNCVLCSPSFVGTAKNDDRL